MPGNTPELVKATRDIVGDDGVAVPAGTPGVVVAELGGFTLLVEFRIRDERLVGDHRYTTAEVDDRDVEEVHE